MMAFRVVCLLHFVLWADYFSDFNRESAAFTEQVLPDNPLRDVLAGLILDHIFRGKATFVQFLDYYIIWKKGVATTRFLHARSFPVTAKPSPSPLPSYNEWIGLNAEYRGEYRDIDFLLVRGDIPEAVAPYLRDYSLFKPSGDWNLYKRSGPD